MLLGDADVIAERLESAAFGAPNADDYDYDLDAALSSIVALRAHVPPDAFTAGVLGTERAGNGVVIRANGLVLTIGYLITEAESVWLHTGDKRTIPGHALAYDQETGFGLVQALAPLDVPPLPLGRSGEASVGEYVVVGGAGGPQRSAWPCSGASGRSAPPASRRR